MTRWEGSFMAAGRVFLFFLIAQWLPSVIVSFLVGVAMGLFVAWRKGVEPSCLAALLFPQGNRRLYLLLSLLLWAVVWGGIYWLAATLGTPHNNGLVRFVAVGAGYNLPWSLRQSQPVRRTAQGDV